jgi:hypothetical protein
MKGANMRKRLYLVMAVAVLAGCASAPRSNDAMLTYETMPAGATLFEGNRSLGVAPVTQTYKHDGKSQTIRSPEVTAVWPSGAKETFFTVLPLGADRVATIERPKSAPGLEADLDHAKKIAAANARNEQRAKEAAARDIARASARCRDQQQRGGTAAIDDCN